MSAHSNFGLNRVTITIIFHDDCTRFCDRLAELSQRKEFPTKLMSYTFFLFEIIKQEVVFGVQCFVTPWPLDWVLSNSILKVYFIIVYFRLWPISINLTTITSNVDLRMFVPFRFSEFKPLSLQIHTFKY